MSAAPVLSTALRVLTFRATREELRSMDARHLTLGLLLTWLVGIGRTWDDPGAPLAQRLGFASLAVLLALSGVLWGVIAPLGADGFSWRNLLTFLALTAPPALVYAIPLGRFLPLRQVNDLNMNFLHVVAAWRVALLVFYLRRCCRLPWFSTAVATVLPLAVLVIALSLLNLDRAAFDMMASHRGVRTPDDASYQVLVSLAALSLLVLPVAVIAWFVLVARREDSLTTLRKPA